MVCLGLERRWKIAIALKSPRKWKIMFSPWEVLEVCWQVFEYLTLRDKSRKTFQVNKTQKADFDDTGVKWLSCGVHCV